jgi:hypothetical protein
VDALDHWLVLADQLERAGMPRQDVFHRAMSIVDAPARTSLRSKRWDPTKA